MTRSVSLTRMRRSPVNYVIAYFLLINIICTSIAKTDSLPGSLGLLAHLGVGLEPHLGAVPLGAGYPYNFTYTGTRCAGPGSVPTQPRTSTLLGNFNQRESSGLGLQKCIVELNKELQWTTTDGTGYIVMTATFVVNRKLF